MKRLLFSAANALHTLADKVSATATRTRPAKEDNTNDVKALRSDCTGFITYYNDMPVATIKGI